MDYEHQNAQTWGEELKGAPESVLSGESTGAEETASDTPAGQGKLHIRANHPLQVAPRKSGSFVASRAAQGPKQQIQHPCTASNPPKRSYINKWQRASHRKPIHEAVPPKIRRLDTENDNAAQTCWRAHREPALTILVPLETGTNICDNLATLAKEAGCFLRCVKCTDRGASLGIWGNKQDAQNAKNAIAAALGDERGQGAGKSAFAKLASLTPELQRRHERRWYQDVKRNRFRQIPPADVAFGAIGSYHWPSKEYKPENVLGFNCEALDAIRMDCECYINYYAEVNCFQVMGDLKQVQQALLRIRNTCFQLMARSLNQVRVYLPHWRASIVPSHVYFEPYHGPRVIAPPTVQDEEPNYSPRGEGILDDSKEMEDARKNSLLSVERVRVTLANALRKLHFYQGHITLVIRLGMFILRQYKLPKDELFELREYEDMAKRSQFVGTVTEEVGDAAASIDVLSTIQSASDILIPHDPMIEDLKDVRPVFAAVFVFKDGNGDLRLVKSWREAELPSNIEGVANPDSWTRLDRDTGAAVQLLDLALTDVHTGGAWQFDVTATRAVDVMKVPRLLLDFARGVRINTAAALRHDNEECFITYNSYIPLKSLRQETHYHYGIQQSDYTLDLVRFQNRTFPEGQSMIKQVPPTVTETCWGLSVSRADWATEFSKNQRLPIGTSADWRDDFESWFPAMTGDGESSSDGFLHLIEKLERIEEILRVTPADED